MIESVCFNDSKFILASNETVVFDVAQQLCIDRHDGELASVRSEEEFDLLTNGILADITGLRFYIGLSRQEDEVVSNTSDPTNFQFIDGFEDTSFFANAGQEPWASGQPNNDIGNQRCVEWDRNDATDRFALWNDKPCDELTSFMCRVSCLVTDDPVSDPIEDEEIEGSDQDSSHFFYLVGAFICLLGLIIILRFLVVAKRRLKNAVNTQVFLESGFYSGSFT